MLRVCFESGDRLAPIYAKLGLSEKADGANFVMYDDDVPVALWRMRILRSQPPVCDVDRIAFDDSVSEEDRIFFFHAMMYKLQGGCPIVIKAPLAQPYLKKFGFEEVDGALELNSADINLYYNCRG